MPKTWKQHKCPSNGEWIKKPLYTNHQGNANPNHNGIPPHTCYFIIKRTKDKFGEDVEKGNPCALWVGMHQ